jgi:hypothetical protein
MIIWRCLLYSTEVARCAREYVYPIFLVAVVHGSVEVARPQWS